MQTHASVAGNAPASAHPQQGTNDAYQGEPPIVALGVDIITEGYRQPEVLKILCLCNPHQNIDPPAQAHRLDLCFIKLLAVFYLQPGTQNDIEILLLPHRSTLLPSACFRDENSRR